ncbi:SDR family oxidoreductase [Mycobacterium avium subsp. hominissuis]|uniref:Oxidoreductase n=5 Tax=Mycobacterium TaxID=1763 RepID=A0A7G1IHA3_MYCKA|nr:MULTISPECIES: SDR family oxidoreductase [Mycobacterium]RUP05990.1 MAG: SDR family oxidoreductase [Mycobacterium sp.]ATQ40827.1 SDR family oxidoreductase [Mycobacterium avium subsp. hominissuis]ETZ42908.1 short chain dehydrogenase family protein [Mycobacterium avium MAV_120709_2344]MCA2334262.1 SDR family oxidoreductase [Mycobacterium avium]MCQ4363514.1 SDR family oxidoreductase [Mycobacterium gordonae]
MTPRPISDLAHYRAAGKLDGKVALITGGDSGIGRAVAIAYAKEGADVAIAYNIADEDAATTKTLIEQEGRRCVALKVDLATRHGCRHAVDETTDALGGLNILVNNAAYGRERQRFEDIDEAQLRRVFDVNILACFHLAQAALAHMTVGDAIISTSSVGGVYGAANFVDYAATKGAIDAFTKALALNLGPRGIRVNAVAPGAIWTPFQVALNTPQTAQAFPHAAPKMSATGRIGQPEELAAAYVYLASPDASFTSGIVVEVHGGWIGWG